MTDRELPSLDFVKYEGHEGPHHAVRNPDLIDAERQAAYESRRNEIIAGLKRWALGSYPEQVAIEFLAGTNEPLTRPWVEHSTAFGEDRYWFNWETYDQRGGTLSGGERRTWELCRSLIEGELNDLIWGIDDPRFDSFIAALARRHAEWR